MTDDRPPARNPRDAGELPAGAHARIRPVDHRTGQLRPAAPPATARLECERCYAIDDVELRTLFGRRDLTSAVLLCKDCNDTVQGADHVNVTTENRFYP